MLLYLADVISTTKPSGDASPLGGVDVVLIVVVLAVLALALVRLRRR